MKLTRLLGAAALTAFGLAAQPMQAQTFPDHPVSLVVGTAPGGGSDAIARTLAAALSEIWKQPVVVENRPGADGSIATGLVKQAPADGYTLLFVNNAFSLSPVHMDVGYDYIKDFAPISQLAEGVLVLGLNPSLGVKSADELVAYSKANPGKLSGGASGNANATWNALKMLTDEAKLDIVAIPYKGAAAMLTGLMANEVQVGFSGIASIKPQLASEGGSLVGVAITGKTRSDMLPDLPTMKEAFGLDGFNIWNAWYGVVAPAGIDPALQKKLYDDVKAALDSDSVKNMVAQNGLQLIASTPEEFANTLLEHGKVYAEFFAEDKK